MRSLRPDKPWTTKLSSAGLVYCHFGSQILAGLLGQPEDGPVVTALYDKVPGGLGELGGSWGALSPPVPHSFPQGFCLAGVTPIKEHSGEGDPIKKETSLFQLLVRSWAPGWADPRRPRLRPQLYENFVEEIDAIDNGIAQAEGEPRYALTTTLSARVSHLNPRWNDPDQDTEVGTGNVAGAGVAWGHPASGHPASGHR